jgi:hypothetical protein
VGNQVIDLGTEDVACSMCLSITTVLILALFGVTSLLFSHAHGFADADADLV